jgi:hypothetical protein
MVVMVVACCACDLVSIICMVLVLYYIGMVL